VADDDEARRGRDPLEECDVGRLLALSDGVFAIAMTLLVLGIPVPQLARNASDADLLAALARSIPGSP